MKALHSIKNKNVLIGVNREQSSYCAARLILKDLKAVISKKGYAAWQVSSGGTPKRLYEIITREMRNEIDWQKVILVQMDEYLGTTLADKTSQFYFLNHSLIRKLPFKKVLRFTPEIMENPNLFEERIHSIGGVDIALHGIGVNGHLAFNEPGSEANSRTRIVPLAQSTRVANSRFFKELSHVPTHGITVGMATIKEARKIYLLAFGETKKTAMRRALTETASLNNPASVLQSHSNTVYVLDVESSSEICAPRKPAVSKRSRILEDDSIRELVA